MTPEDVQAIVARSLAVGLPPDADPEATVGIPWSADRYGPEIERLRASLIAPYRQRFELREHDNPERRRVTGQAVYWVVAATGEMYLWYDEATGEFGVGEPGPEGGFPTSIGLRGDLLGAFCAW